MNRKSIRYIVYIIVVICTLLIRNAIAENGAVVIFKEAVSSGVADIEPCESLTVDLTGYKVPDNAGLVVLQIFSDYYYLPIIAGKKIYVFSKEEARPTKRSKKFSGLNRLDSVFLIIGKEAFPGSLDMGAMISNESILVRVGA